MDSLPEIASVSLPEETESSCFRKVMVKEHLSLLPCFIGNLSKGVLGYLSGKVLKYSSHLNGVLLAFSNPTVIQEEGLIFDEQPHIHFDLNYAAYVFRPVVGSVLNGRINKVGSDHVGCLLYDCFNVTVVCKGRNWHNDASKGFPYGLESGADICFRVISLDVTGDVMSLTGDFFDIDNVYG